VDPVLLSALEELVGSHQGAPAGPSQAWLHHCKYTFHSYKSNKFDSLSNMSLSNPSLSNISLSKPYVSSRWSVCLLLLPIAYNTAYTVAVFRNNGLKTDTAKDRVP
jgi:hypothetical protein